MVVELPLCMPETFFVGVLEWELCWALIGCHGITSNLSRRFQGLSPSRANHLSGPFAAGILQPSTSLFAVF
jgi:hypothetical protein